ncbi:flagellar protein FlaG [Caldicoprobacter guelmensis]|uniref:flagellar protein FlaG n=1 Tax=Caldicoprobacter guelmensis TaxID=1170224 RepID=UPI00195CB697|nr:flagellar protein FlaG [Caldicoprobacter guelmensis]MBM7582630.1 flagellar protein FlaG [Caldicoprobacter guelmensis]
MRVEGIPAVIGTKSVLRIAHQIKSTGAKEFGSNMQEMSSTNSDTNVNHQDIIYAVKQVNKALEGTNRRFEYSIHEQTNTIVIKVIDTETNEVIREIPPEKILNLIAKLWELAGIIVDEKV